MINLQRQVKSSRVRLLVLGSTLSVVALAYNCLGADTSDQYLAVKTDSALATCVCRRGSTVVIGTHRGLYRWDDVTKAEPQRFDVGKDYFVNSCFYDDSTLWLATSAGLIRWDDSANGPKEVEVEPFRWIDTDAEKVPAKNGGPPEFATTTQNTAGMVYSIYKDGPHLWFAADFGLFRWSDVSKGKPERVDVDVQQVKALEKDGSTWILGSNSDGLFRWDGRSFQPDYIDFEGSFNTLIKDGSTFWIGTNNGLYHWDDVSKFKPKHIDINYLLGSRSAGLQEMPSIFALYKDGSTLWIGMGEGFLRWENVPSGKPEVIDIGADRIDAFSRVGTDLWIVAEGGLFRLEGVGREWDSGITVINNLATVIYTDHRLPIKWKVTNYRWHTLPSLIESRAVVTDENNKEVQRTEWGRGQQDIILSPFQSGTYYVVVQTKDLLGNVSTSEHVEFQVFSSVRDVVLSWVKPVGLSYGALSLFAFLSLAIYSRWSQRSFEILTDPLTRKFGIYFGFAIRHVPFIRVWVFERYYQNLKRDFGSDRGYVPGPIARSNGSFFVTSAVIGELQQYPQLLVRGGPGTGKTAMVGELMRVYCGESSLRRAKKRYGFIPIVVSLRDFGGQEIGELARDALKGKGMPFAADSFFDLVLLRGDFLIILDGLNEVDIEEQVNQFVATSPAVKLLMTSQTTLAKSGIPTHQLPLVTPGFAKKLLIAFLDNDSEANKTIESIDSNLWDEITSGYDVRLLENLVRAERTLPTNRIKLYETTIEYAASFYDGLYPWDVPCRIAWHLWKSGQRRFQGDAQLTDSLLAPLQKANIVVPRGNQFEFRHDLMRGYLAACWAVRHAVSLDVTQARLSEKEVWDLSPSEQDLVFPFITRLVNTQAELQTIAQFAADDISRRNRLLVACQATAQTKGWIVEVKLVKDKMVDD